MHVTTPRGGRPVFAGTTITGCARRMVGSTSTLRAQAELETLPGSGPARAQAIIAEREARPFRVPGDLRRVPGIGEATFQRLAPLVAVR
jgi:hypothetical protein